MEAIPESLAALAGMNIEQLIMLWLIGMSIAMSRTLRKLLAVIGNKIFGKGTFNTNGNHAAEAQAKADAVRAELRRHEDGCEKRYQRIDESFRQVNRNFEKLFKLCGDNAKAIARIEGFINGMQRREKAA